MNKISLILLPFFGKRIIFFLILLPAGCRQKKQVFSKEVSIVWKDGRATGLSVPKSSFPGIHPNDSFYRQLELRLANHGKQPAMPGDYIVNEEEVIFKPLIPFTRGLRYEVFVQHQYYAAIEIPVGTGPSPSLTIYPSGDSLPENLLKIYLQFPHPVQEAHPLQYIKLIDDKGDSLPNSFLDLQPGLWNSETTMLTLWLDPGRIKRDLQPNKLMGPPLIKGKKYTLVIASGWPDKQGVLLGKEYTKNFTATTRDTVSPAPENWKLSIPAPGTIQPFEADFAEPLDYILLLNAIRMTDFNGNNVNGQVKTGYGEMKYYFIPAQPWQRGRYKLQIEARLADLAGNNLNRVFDLDLKSPDASRPAKKIFEKEWQIK